MRVNQINTNWTKVLYVWMHDPVDKALDVGTHKSRAARYVSCAVGKPVTYRDIDVAVKSADIAAAIADRLPMPNAGMGGKRAVELGDCPLEIRHPVSAEKHTLTNLVLDEAAVRCVIEDIVRTLPTSPRARFLALWRLLPERLAKKLGRDFALLPADTRVPDHSLFQHSDIATGISTGSQSQGGYAYLSVAIGPVQAFIEAARSVRDLWTGSALLSWLVFQGMRPVLKQFGPTALVFPALRANPLADLWLRDQGGLEDHVPLPSVEARRAPSIPNRFLALVPWGSDGEVAKCIAQQCEEAIRAGWHQVSDAVHSHVDPVFRRFDSNWDDRWSDQVESFFEITISLLPDKPLTDEMLAGLVGNSRSFGDVWEDAYKVRELSRCIPSSERYRFPQNGAGRWQAKLELSARLVGAQRAIRHVPVLPADATTPQKCSLLGSYEQMGPAELSASAEFWRHAQASRLRLRERERFSAIALCKRFAAETLLYQELNLCLEDLRFPDTATVAAEAWLNEASVTVGERWSGRWLHQRKRDEVEPGDEVPSEEVWNRITMARKRLGNPPSYYAVLMMDADNMGRWLNGEFAPKAADVIHPKLVDYFRKLEGADLDVKRPVGPALHAAISEALNNFASHMAPRIVKEFHGTLIYSGGDDVLALLPAHQALDCTKKLRQAFQGEGRGVPGWTEIDGHQYLSMGCKATLSAGLAFVHYKHDLREAIGAARKAEKFSKDHGRNRITLRIVHRSGKKPVIKLTWNLIPWLQSIVEAFASGVSDRWLYHLRRELPTLSDAGLPAAAVAGEIRRLVARSQDQDAQGEGSPASRPEEWWEEYCSLADSGKCSVRAFTHLCLGASFIARGHAE